MKKAHFEILDKKRKKMLPYFKHFKDRFYLAGGTGLALQLGHRDSVDFDFFTPQEFNSEELLREVKQVFAGYVVDVIQVGNMTLNLILEEEVKVSFFCIKDKLLKPPLDLDYFRVASIEDIACMKMGALLRAEYKDYVDLYYIFKQKSLREVIEACKAKYPGFDEMVYLKALVSFDDINLGKILFLRGKQVKLDEIKRDFQKRVKEYLKQEGLR